MALPVVSYLKLPEDGDPYIEGHKCSSCGSVFWVKDQYAQIAHPETLWRL